VITKYTVRNFEAFCNEDFRNTEAGNLVKVYSVLGYLNNDLMKYFENYQYK